MSPQFGQAMTFGAVTLSWCARRMSRRERLVLRLGVPTGHSFVSLLSGCGSNMPSKQRSSSGSSLVAGKLCLELLERQQARVDRPFAAEILDARPQVFGHLDPRAIRRAQRLH